MSARSSVVALAIGLASVLSLIATSTPSAAAATSGASKVLLGHATFTGVVQGPQHRSGAGASHVFSSGVAPTHLTIVPTFDASVTSSPEAAQIEAAFTDAISAFETTYSDPITVDVNVVWGVTGLGASNQELFGFGYNTVRSALVSNATSADQLSAAGELPSVDPITAPTRAAGFYLPLPEAMALGLLPADCFSSGQPCATYAPTITLNAAAAWTFDPNNRAVNGTYDFIGVAEHELSEILGRISTLSSASTYAPSIEDFFRYTAPHVASYVPWVTGGYLSVDDGVTSLAPFNSLAQGDAADYASSTPDPFNAFASSGVALPLTAADLTNMDALGYHRISGALLSQAISFSSTPPTSPVVGGPTYGVSANGGASGNPVTFAIDASAAGVCSITGAVVSFLGAGTCTIDANQAGTATYAAAPQAQQTMTVITAPQSIAFSALGAKTYGDAPFTVAATATSGQPVSFASKTAAVCTVASATVTILAAGTCSVVASQSGDATWSAAAQVVRSFTVARAPLTITADDASLTYGQALPVFGYAVSGLVNADPTSVVTGVTCTKAGSLTPKAGSYAISCAGGAATSYVLAYLPGTLTVRYALAKVSPLEATSYHAGAVVPVKFQLTDVHGTPISTALASSLGCELRVKLDSAKGVCASYVSTSHFFHAWLATSSALGVHVVTIKLKVGSALLVTKVINLTAT